MYAYHLRQDSPHKVSLEDQIKEAKEFIDDIEHKVANWTPKDTEEYEIVTYYSRDSGHIEGEAAAKAYARRILVNAKKELNDLQHLFAILNDKTRRRRSRGHNQPDYSLPNKGSRSRSRTPKSGGKKHKTRQYKGNQNDSRNFRNKSRRRSRSRSRRARHA